MSPSTLFDGHVLRHLPVTLQGEPLATGPRRGGRGARVDDGLVARVDEHGRSLDECRANLKDSLQLMVETNRDSARIGLDPSCILESIEIDLAETTVAQAMARSAKVNTSAYVH